MRNIVNTNEQPSTTNLDTQIAILKHFYWQTEAIQTFLMADNIKTLFIHDLLRNILSRKFVLKPVL